jgi:hypothetical protein
MSWAAPQTLGIQIIAAVRALAGTVIAGGNTTAVDFDRNRGREGTI